MCDGTCNADLISDEKVAKKCMQNITNSKIVARNFEFHLLEPLCASSLPSNFSLVTFSATSLTYSRSALNSKFFVSYSKLF
jgi:hypothetical protein